MRLDVALHARAWIETDRRAYCRASCRRSPYMRGRGSKPASRPRPDRPVARRPPCEGVDRNEEGDISRCWISGRPPCEGVDRNAKVRCSLPVEIGSPSMRGRGSKLSCCDGNHRSRSPSMRGRGSKPAWSCRMYACREGRPPCEGVDRNMGQAWDTGETACRPPCEGVDRNHSWANQPTYGIVSPSMRGRGSKRSRSL